MYEKYSIRLKVSFSFSSFANKIELDWSKFLDWNEEKNNRNYIQNKSEMKLSSEVIRRRKIRKINKKKK